MTKRLFLGIPVPTKDKKTLFESIEPLQKEYYDWRWVKKENYHITVSFFGTIDVHDINSLTALVKPIISQTRSFSLQLNELSLAPTHSSPRMLWAKGSDATEFVSLVTQTESKISEHIELPNFRRDQAPLPHVTLARFDPKHTKVDSLPLPALRMTAEVTTCILFESILTPDGPTYNIFKEYSLKQD